MRKIYPAMIFVALAAAFGASEAQAGGKTTICHFPPGNPANFHTITVGDKAVGAHVNNHDDLVGSCQANCESICDDGNACTIDVVPDTEQCICAAEPRAQVDCSDGNFCTADSCDPVSGSCVNDPGPQNGLACDDDNSNTIDEACFGGSCDPPCPCFTGADILANGAVGVCGSNFPGFPNLTGIIWTNGGRSCSGERCFSVVPGQLTCGITSPVTGAFSLVITPQEDQNCQALILNYCPNPNLNEGLTSEEESTTPFIDG